MTLHLFLYLLLGGLLSGSVVAAVLGLWLTRRTGRRTWKERSMSELLGPLHMQLARTGRAYRSYMARKTFLEAKILREGNLAIRDLLLRKPHLIPPVLFEDASRLVEHYDRWFEEYERLRSAENPALESRFVFAGRNEFPFPSDAEARFHDAYQRYWNELYRDLG
jgi:hypothetical protein